MLNPIWTPSDDRIEQANITKFCNGLRTNGKGDFASYDDLWDWSVSDLDNFWSEFWDFSGIIGYKGETILSNSKHLIDTDFFQKQNLILQKTFYEQIPSELLLYITLKLVLALNGHGTNYVRQYQDYNKLYNKVALLRAIGSLGLFQIHLIQ